MFRIGEQVRVNGYESLPTNHNAEDIAKMFNKALNVLPTSK